MIEFIEINPSDTEPKLRLHIYFEDNEELILRITQYTLNFAEGTFIKNNQDVPFHDSFNVEFPAFETLDITTLLSHLHAHGSPTSISIKDNTDTKVFYTDAGNYWNCIQGLLSIAGEEETIRNYQLVFVHEVK